MRFSVIIPCHNAERYIQESLLSAANQTLSPIEIIVVDDGSTDSSVRIVKSSGVKSRLISTRGLGGAGARNRAIEVTIGEWLAFVDAKEIWYATRLSRARDLICANPVAGYVSHYDHGSFERERLKTSPCLFCHRSITYRHLR